MKLPDVRMNAHRHNWRCYPGYCYEEPKRMEKTVHPATAAILQYFEYYHLPDPLQGISRRCSDLAIAMASELDGPELTAGLRKLLEAKDCFVRASIPGQGIIPQVRGADPAP